MDGGREPAEAVPGLGVFGVGLPCERAGRRALDPRLIQIAILSALLVLGVARLDLAVGLWQAPVTLSAALVTQLAGCRLRGERMDWRSPAITALSLTLLLRTHEPLLWAACGAIGVGSKFVLRVRGKHLFNPACFAIVAALLGSHAVWVSPGQWGALAWGAVGLASAGGLVLSRVGRVDVAAAFLGGYAALLALRCLALGDPWAIPLHQVQSGALLVFAFFMITDPRSTPDSRAGRVVFALAVAGIAHLLQFGWQVREGLFYALALVSPATPFLDVVLPARRFRWEVRCAS